MTAYGALRKYILSGSVVVLLCGAPPAPLLITQDITVVSRTTVHEHPHADPYDRANLYGFNHAPSVTTLTDGRLLAAWFSGPFEASVDQVILGAYSSDGGQT